MKSLKELYKVGIGPSSSHTIAPSKIAEFMRSKYPRATHFKVILFGSLALTGKGHGTDVAIKKILGENTEIIFDMETTDLPHVNTMDRSE
ncbi:MAG: L-serine ammonia-lyase, partial [Clostridia bacterium]|nr:L-serine ammonia-lyase [Clostridia bacterium]